MKTTNARKQGQALEDEDPIVAAVSVCLRVTGDDITIKTEINVVHDCFFLERYTIEVVVCV